MNEPVTIPKRPLVQSESLDYARLRKQGVDYIASLGSDFWTDFNVHDPGITQQLQPVASLFQLL